MYNIYIYVCAIVDFVLLFIIYTFPQKILCFGLNSNFKRFIFKHSLKFIHYSFSRYIYDFAFRSMQIYSRQNGALFLNCLKI